MKPVMHLRALVASIALFSFVAWAEEATEPLSVLHAQQLVEQLNAALEERDAMILELAARVRALEQRLNSGAVPAPSFDKRPELDIATLSAEEELDEADRLAQTALERTLIQSGGLLLPAGRIEIEPYSASGTSIPSSLATKAIRPTYRYVSDFRGTCNSTRGCLLVTSHRRLCLAMGAANVPRPLNSVILRSR